MVSIAGACKTVAPKSLSPASIAWLIAPRRSDSHLWRRQMSGLGVTDWDAFEIYEGGQVSCAGSLLALCKILDFAPLSREVRKVSTPVVENSEPNFRNGPEAEIQTETLPSATQTSINGDRSKVTVFAAWRAGLPRRRPPGLMAELAPGKAIRAR